MTHPTGETDRLSDQELTEQQLVGEHENGEHAFYVDGCPICSLDHDDDDVDRDAAELVAMLKNGALAIVGYGFAELLIATSLF